MFPPVGGDGSARVGVVAVPEFPGAVVGYKLSVATNTVKEPRAAVAACPRGPLRSSIFRRGPGTALGKRAHTVHHRIP